MAVTFRGPVDSNMEALAAALRVYTDAHPSAEAEVFRYSRSSVRARIIDPDFRGKNRSERHRSVWPLVATLDDDVLGELTMLLLITPEERATSVVNQDFEGPTFEESYPRRRKLTQESGTASP